MNGIGVAARGEASDVVVRRLADGREFSVPKIYYAASDLERALKEAGFATATVSATPRFFLLGHATA